MSEFKQAEEPGTVGDLDLGLPGETEPQPDAETDEPTRINDDEEVEDDG